MPQLIKKQCPVCGHTMNILPEASKIGVVCPQCKSFIGDKNDKKMSEEELKRITAALHELLSNK